MLASSSSALTRRSSTESLPRSTTWRAKVPIEVEDKYVSVARIFDTADEIPESYKGNKYVRPSATRLPRS